MEQARMLFAITLSFLVFFVWNYFFVEPPEQVPEKPELKKTAVKKDAAPVVPTVTEQNPAPKPLATLADKSLVRHKQGRFFRIETPLYIATISEQNCAFTSFVLKKYQETVSPDSPFKELIQKKNLRGTDIVSLANGSADGLNNALFTSNETNTSIKLDQTSRSLTFSWLSSNGIRIQNTYQFYPGQYGIDLQVTIFNQGRKSVTDSLVLTLNKQMEKKSNGYGFKGPGALIGNSFEKVDVDDIGKTPQLPGAIQWISIQDRYFLSAIIPLEAKDARMDLRLDAAHIVQTDYVEPSFTLPVGSNKTFKYQLFNGPKSVSLLKSMQVGLDQAVDFGFFDILAKPCLWLMNFLYRYIPNYGITIIVLTILIKLLFWPLGTKSYKSMNDMKKLQPLMTEIREKYKDDKQRMNQEIMGLYKTYKINPLGGCLPMAAQIPVFFALYRMLYGAIELRHAPFIGWINDLSAPDRLFTFSYHVPFMQPPYGIPVLTIIMGLTMLIQQKLQPPAGDPTQAKMMMFMPIVFTVIFINFSSGLVLYWLINNIISIAQQYYVSKTKA